MLNKYFSSFIVSGICFLALGITGCKKLFPSETIPCYGHIDSIGITTNYALNGTASANINCVWVYVDDQPAGAFEMPCTFPIVTSGGSHTISLYPGVTDDGMSATRSKYPFYTYSNNAVTLTQGKVTNLSFTTTYTDNTDFVWMEDFENPTISISTYTTQSDTSMFKAGAPDAFQGNYSGEVVLDSNSSYNHYEYVGISDSMSLPHNGSQVYLEMNYNTNTLFGVGIFYYDASYLAYIQQPVLVQIFPSTGWKKIYINLVPGIENKDGLFKIYFRLIRPYGATEAKLLLDNIKVLKFKGT